MSGAGGPPGPPAVVRGQVRGPDGAPVAGARVVVTGSPVPVPEIAAVTDAAGGFALAVPAAGEYALAAHAEGFPGGPATGAVAVPAASTGAGGAAAPASVSADPDADVGSDEAVPESAGLHGGAGAPFEVRVVMTFEDATGGGA